MEKQRATLTLTPQEHGMLVYTIEAEMGRQRHYATTLSSEEVRAVAVENGQLLESISKKLSQA